MLSDRDFGQNLVNHTPFFKHFVQRRFGVTRERAEDFVQEGLLRMWEYRAQFDGANFKAWAFTVLRNLVTSELKTEARRHRLALATIDTSEGHDGAQEATVDLIDTLHLMVKLPEDQLAAMIMKARGYSTREAADIEYVPEGTIKSRVCRGRDTLRAALEGVAA